MLPRRQRTSDLRLATDSRNPNRPVGLSSTLPDREARHSIEQSHMDKKVTSTFHCVASGQVLKALRGGRQPKFSAQPAESRHPQSCHLPAKPCDLTIQRHTRIEGRASPTNELDAVRYLIDDCPERQRHSFELGRHARCSSTLGQDPACWHRVLIARPCGRENTSRRLGQQHGRAALFATPATDRCAAVETAHDETVPVTPPPVGWF